MTTRIDRIRKLLHGIETGDPASVAVISPTQYIQHNPQTQTGREGLAALFARLSKSSPRVNVVRAFADGDYVFGHTEYDFATRRIGFEVFRFEGELAVEHWDNIQPRRGPNASGQTMVGGPTEVCDLDRTEVNRELVRHFVQRVRIEGDLQAVEDYVDRSKFVEHSPDGHDGFPALQEQLAADRSPPVVYRQLHRVLAQGNFALAVSEGERAGERTAFYDLYRVEGRRLVEHWDTVEAVPPAEEWRHDNGKF